MVNELGEEEFDWIPSLDGSIIIEIALVLLILIAIGIYKLLTVI